MQRKNCQNCSHRMNILTANMGGVDKFYWTCQCGFGRQEFSEAEAEEYAKLKSIGMSVNFLKETEKSKNREEQRLRATEREAEKTTKVITSLAAGEPKTVAAKKAKVSPSKVHKIATAHEGDIEDQKKFLINESLDLAKEAHRIIKEDEYLKLRTLDGYKLTLSAKISGQAALELSSGLPNNLNIVNFQALVERVSGAEHKTNAIIENKEEKEELKKDIEDADVH